MMTHSYDVEILSLPGTAAEKGGLAVAAVKMRQFLKNQKPDQGMTMGGTA